MAGLNGWRLTRAGVVFVAGIIVLALVVFGVIMFVRERGEQARRDEAIAVAEQNLETQSEVSNTPVSEPEESEGDDAWTNTAPGTPVDMTPGAAELPETGIEGIGPVVILALMTLAIAYYATSRRTVRGL